MGPLDSPMTALPGHRQPRHTSPMIGIVTDSRSMLERRVAALEDQVERLTRIIEERLPPLP